MCLLDQLPSARTYANEWKNWEIATDDAALISEFLPWAMQFQPTQVTKRMVQCRDLQSAATRQTKRCVGWRRLLNEVVQITVVMCGTLLAPCCERLFPGNVPVLLRCRSCAVPR